MCLKDTSAKVDSTDISMGDYLRGISGFDPLARSYVSSTSNEMLCRILLDLQLPLQKAPIGGPAALPGPQGCPRHSCTAKIVPDTYVQAPEGRSKCLHSSFVFNS